MLMKTSEKINEIYPKQIATSLVHRIEQLENMGILSDKYADKDLTKEDIQKLYFNLM